MCCQPNDYYLYGGETSKNQDFRKKFSVYVDVITFFFYYLALRQQESLKATWRKPRDRRMAQRGEAERES